MKNKILCIEDDPISQTLIKLSLKEFNIVIAANLFEAEKEINNNDFSLALIDIQLPDGDGIHFYSQFKKNSKLEHIPVVFLSGNDQISNKLLAFSLGADDFITKPFDPLELNARVQSKIVKSISKKDEKKIKILGDVQIDFDRQKVFYTNNGNEIDLNLTSKEQKMLSFISNRLEQVFSREQILNNVWANTHITDRTVDSHMAHLRSKLQNTQIDIKTVKNFGYKLTIKQRNT
jgi:DNA-binding response OmpR family regulator